MVPTVSPRWATSISTWHTVLREPGLNRLPAVPQWHLLTVLQVQTVLYNIYILAAYAILAANFSRSRPMLYR